MKIEMTLKLYNAFGRQFILLRPEQLPKDGKNKLVFKELIMENSLACLW